MPSRKVWIKEVRQQVLMTGRDRNDPRKFRVMLSCGHTYLSSKRPAIERVVTCPHCSELAP